jgi:hypothetical protein
VEYGSGSSDAGVRRFLKNEDRAKLVLKKVKGGHTDSSMISCCMLLRTGFENFIPPDTRLHRTS